jgi:Leucine Rich repeat
VATIASVRPWQRYLRISLRGLIVLVLVLGSVLGWIVNRAKVQHDAVAAIERTGGSVTYQWEWKDEGPNSSEKPKWPIWVLDHVGPNYLAHIAGANVASGGSDEQLLAVGKLKSLEGLVVHKSSITSAGLAALTRLDELRSLCIFNSQANDSGMEPLSRLARLDNLSLNGTNIGDKGLAHLKSLTNLKVLDLGGTAITDEGLAHLEGLSNLALKANTKLHTLVLTGTNVTDAGVLRLQQSLPELKIVR